MQNGDGGLSMVGDWAIDSLQGAVPESTTGGQGAGGRSVPWRTSSVTPLDYCIRTRVAPLTAAR